MKTIFHPKLINGLFGDPGLLVEFMFEKRALLFDLGDLGKVSNGTLLKISDVFVSHTHIDHFIGFDRLLRVCFGRDKTIRLYGPEHFIRNVEGKLAGFTWNLVDRYDESITIEVTEVHQDHLKRATFRAIDRFEISGAGETAFADGLLLDERAFSVSTAILEHRVPCLGFALKEKVHVNINGDYIDMHGFLRGPWLQGLKSMIYKNASDDTPVTVPIEGERFSDTKDIPLGELKKELVTITEGQKIGYVVDTVFNDENNQRIVGLVRNADQFFCESPFLGKESERGRDRCHLTSVQAGMLARMAGVRQLNTFHFSAKHLEFKAQLIKEAQQAFNGGTMDVL